MSETGLVFDEDIKFFFLHPTAEKFADITNPENECRLLSRMPPSAYYLWKAAATIKWEFSGKVADISEQVSRLSYLLVSKPRLEYLYQMWCLFFATGQDEFFESAFGFAGNPNLSSALRQTATDTTRTVIDEMNLRGCRPNIPVLEAFALDETTESECVPESKNEETEDHKKIKEASVLLEELVVQVDRINLSPSYRRKKQRKRKYTEISDP